MSKMPALVRAALLPVLLLSACDGTTDPAPDTSLAFDAATVGLGEARAGAVVVRNTGDAAVGPVEVVAGPVVRAGVELPGVAVAAAPSEIATLNPGDSAIVQIQVTGTGPLQAGTYDAAIEARVQGTRMASATLTFDVTQPALLIGSVVITEGPDSMRQGDIVQFEAVVYDTLGQVVPAAIVTWTATTGAGLFSSSGEFVPYGAGAASIIARAGAVADTLDVVIAQRGMSGSFSVVGHGAVPDRFTSDLWAHGDVAYTATWGFRTEPGDMMYAWDISGATPVLTDSIRINALTVDDVMIRADGRLAIITHEYMQEPKAITLVDMTDPAHPTIAGEYDSDFVDGWIGVHNAWLEGDYAYIVVDGAAENRGLWILDVSDPANPHRVARFYGGSSFLHDVIVRDGLAFLSHWDAGLIILDVGNGIRGGSPSNPVEVSRIVTSGGQVHNAWYWPETGYVFIGEEDFWSPGRMHVIDASDIERPIEVASFRVAGDTPHNLWLDEENAVLYTSWYSRGVQAIDVSGRLQGALDRQGRLIASIEYAGSSVNDCPAIGDVGTSSCAWGPQLHDGFIYVADMNTGIWKLQADLP